MTDTLRRYMHYRITFILCVVAFKLTAQTGGSATFQFIDAPKSATISAMGGTIISQSAEDMSVGLNNPAQYDTAMSKRVAVTTGFFPAGISYEFAGYAQAIRNVGVVALGVQDVSYGKFDYADDAGNRNGATFTANEYLINGGISRRLDKNFNYGINLKFIGSKLESYHAYGLAGDAGIYYHDSSGRFTAGAVVANAGNVFSNYVSGTTEALPTDVQIAVSKKLAKAPFRFTILLHNLETWNMHATYPYEAQQMSTLLDSSQSTTKKNYTVNNIFSHINFCAEIVFSKNFQIQCAYNYKEREELGFTARESLSGVSMGFLLRIKRFTFAYAYKITNVAAGTNLLSLNINCNGIK